MKKIVKFFVFVSFFFFSIGLAHAQMNVTSNINIFAELISAVRQMIQKIDVLKNKIDIVSESISTSTISSSSLETILPLATSPSSTIFQNKKNENEGKDQHSDRVEIIVFAECDYEKEVLKMADDTLTDNNIECLNWNGNYSVRNQLKLIYNRYSGVVPPNQWPLIVYPTDSALVSGLIYSSEFPNLGYIAPYKWGGNTMPNFFDIQGIDVPPDLILVGGGGRGSQTNDWTSGNGVDFIDFSPIQYNDPLPHTDYIITRVEPGIIPNTTNLYNSVLGYHVKSGWLVWLKPANGSENEAKRINVRSVSPDRTYITIQENISNIVDWRAWSNYLSGSNGVIAAKLNKIMRTAKVDFKTAVEAAKETASNKGVWNPNSGWGYINVQAAIDLILNN